MEQFTFYEWYADILQSMDDISAGKLENCICAYEFEDREPMEQLSNKEDFYWSNIASILKEVKETESIGKIPKKYNLQSKHFTFYETYYKAMKLMNTRKQGIFVKAICAYMFGNEEPKFEDGTMHFVQTEVGCFQETQEQRAKGRCAEKESLRSIFDRRRGI